LHQAQHGVVSGFLAIGFPGDGNAAVCANPAHAGKRCRSKDNWRAAVSLHRRLRRARERI
jgi:hypothetical protein